MMDSFKPGFRSRRYELRQFNPSTRDNGNAIDFDYFGLHFNKLANALLWINQYGILYFNLVFYSTQSCIKPISNKSDVSIYHECLC